MADEYGCVGVVVDAKPDAEAFYAKYGFIAIEAVEGRSDARPAPTLMFLSIRAIGDAVGNGTRLNWRGESSIGNRSLHPGRQRHGHDSVRSVSTNLGHLMTIAVPAIVPVSHQNAAS
jgi:hypothetical protein